MAFTWFRRAASLLALLLVGALLAAAVLPRVMDWNRYRDTVTDLARRAIGQDVRIQGDIALRLLPEPELVAGGISLADPALGAHLAARSLRLDVAFWPLLAGRIEARTLLLGEPELTLDWPLKGLSLARRPGWLGDTQMRIAAGRLRIGGVLLEDIDATLEPDALTGNITLAGQARLTDASWRFSLQIGPAAGDGSASLEMVLDGTGAVQDTGGRFSGLIAADGSITGRMEARGRDLSRLLPAPPVAWSAEGRVSASGGLALADDLDLRLDKSPARGVVALRVAPQPRLDLALRASRIDLDGWLPVLLRGGTGRLPTGLDISADAATLAGGMLRDVRASFELRPDGVGVREARAGLPGGASLLLTGALAHVDGAARFTGTAHLRAPDLRGTLAWLAATGLVHLGDLPPASLHSAEIDGQVQIGPDTLDVATLKGQIDGTSLTGSANIRIGAQPRVALDLALDRLDLDSWLPAGFIPRRPPPAAQLALKLTAPQATWRGMALRDLRLDAAITDGAIALNQLEAELRGTHVSASLAIGRDGRVNDAKMDATTEDASDLAALLPAPWAALPIWHGRVGLSLSASGPADALAVRLAAEMAEGRLDAQPLVNLDTGAVSGRLVLRHPGAPRLLDMLGLRQAGQWFGDGSLALNAQIAASSGHIGLESFDLTAGTMRTHGQLSLDLTGATPRLTGQLTADALPLPPIWDETDAQLPANSLLGWNAALRIDAGQLFAGGRTLLGQTSFGLGLEGGVLRIESLHGEISGGTLSGRFAVDANANPPRIDTDLTLADAEITEAPTGLPVDLQSGRVDATVALTMHGFSRAALLAGADGHLHLALHDGTLRGFDLTALAGILQAHRPVDRTAITQNLAEGTTAVTLFTLDGAVHDGNLLIGSGDFAGPAGSGNISGSVNLSGPTLDLRIAARPAVADAPSPELALRLTGPATTPTRVPEFAGLTEWEAARASSDASHPPEPP